MADIVVTVGSNDYHMSSKYYADLSFVDGFLVNSGQTTFTMVSEYTDDSSLNYPYIRCSANSVCRLYTGSNYNYTAVRNDVEYNGSMFRVVDYGYMTTLLLLILLCFRLFFKK